MEKPLFSTSAQTNDDFGCHVLDLVIYPNRNLSFNLTFESTVSDIISYIEKYISDDFIIIRNVKNQSKIVFEKCKDSTDEQDFKKKKLLDFRWIDQSITTKFNRFTLFVYPIDVYKRHFEFKSYLVSNRGLIKTHQLKPKILVSLPNEYSISITIKYKSTVGSITKRAYEKMVNLYPNTKFHDLEHYLMKTLDGKTESPEIRFFDSKVFEEPLMRQKSNPFTPQFKLEKEFKKNIYHEVVSNYVNLLHLEKPEEDFETHALLLDFSKVRQEIRNEHVNRINQDPLSEYLRLSNFDPPIVDNRITANDSKKKGSVSFRSILKVCDTEAALQTITITMPIEKTADEAIEKLFSLYTRRSITIAGKWQDYAITPLNSDEVIYGQHKLNEFVCVRQFFLSPKHLFDVELVPKEVLINNIKELEKITQWNEEPDPNNLLQSIKVPDLTPINFYKNPAVPNTSIINYLKVHINAVHNVHVSVLTVRLVLFNGLEKFCDPIDTKFYLSGRDSIINETVTVPVALSSIPRTTRLSLTIIGNNKFCSTLNTTLYTYDGWLNTRPQKKRMWKNKNADSLLTAVESHEKDAPIIEFYILPFNFPVFYKEQVFNSNGTNYFLSREEKNIIESVYKRNVMDSITDDEKRLIWKARLKIEKDDRSMIMILSSIDYKNPSQVSEIPYLLNMWNDPNPLIALTLLDAKFPHPYIRSFAVKLLDKLSDAKVQLFTLQIVQSLKYELYDYSPLASFLLRRGLSEPKFLGHSIFWQIISEAHISHTRRRFTLILINLLYGMGIHRDELIKGYLFTEKLSKIYSMKPTSEELREKVEDIEIPFGFRLPTDSMIKVESIIPEKCKVMSSKKKPLFLTFKTKEQNVSLLYKEGDDLRQDQLTLQIMRVMEDIWRQNGLELEMNCYGVLPTGNQKGFVQIVPNAITEAAILEPYGKLGAATNDSAIIDFLKEQSDNNEKLYDKFVQYFLFSSAGYAVATTILGIADRHTDNIMLQRDGHFFHIDFGHFLGNFKKKGPYQREDAPFHFTVALAKALGDRYDYFVEMCCKAYNIIRGNGDLMLTLMMLMLGTGIPELTKKSDIVYMKDMLNLDLDNDSAAEVFKDYIDRSLKSVKTKTNIIFHATKKKSA